ncbi:MAG: SBBP repeat-containing protein, partial [candidate division Zixibacteria bacterium]|nr:SBBP repeat-containing protein [candidate division Zixibacteria bacterium]
YGDSVIYSTYLGGGDHDHGYGIAVDMLGYAYITGYTVSSDFPTENPFQMDQGSYDAFVTKLNSSGTGLEYSTYLGGDGFDYGHSLALHGNGVVVTGYTLSSNFPTKNPFQTDQGVADAFVTKLAYYGDSLIYSTYLGGGGSDYGYGIATRAGAVYVTGSTSSLDFPTLNPYQTHQVVNDVFVTSLSSSGDGLIYSTYLGGELHDYGYGVAVDTSGNAYVVGSTQSSDFPTRNPYQATYQGGANGVLGGDVFVTKLNYGLGDLVYRPDPDGWQFANGHANMWPESWWQQFNYKSPVYPMSFWWTCSPSDFPDWHLFVRAFGVDQCYYDPDPGHPIYKPSAVSRWFDIKQEYGGSCTGFAISSFLFFDGFLDVAAEFPGNTEVYQVPIGDESRLLVNMYWVYQFGEVRRAHQNANMHTTTPTQTLQACKEMFTSDTRNDRVLYMGDNNGHGGHSVNPYRCAVDSVNPFLYHIYIYDNNSPGNENRRVSVNTLTDTWFYDAKPTWGGARRLFLSNPMSDFTTNPIMSRSRVSQDKLISGTERSVSQYAEFYLPSAGDVVFRFSSDSIGLARGSSFSTLTDGIPIIPETGQETPPIGYYLPNRPWSIRLSGFTDSTLKLTAYLDSTVIAYSRNDVDSTQIDELKYGGNDSSIVVVNPDIVSHVYNLQVISIRPDSEVVVKIGGITSEAGDSNHFSITSESGLRIDNYGAASAYSIRVEIAGHTVDTVFFHDSVTIGGNSSHVIVPDWRLNHDSLLVLVDSGMTGYFSDTLVVSNQREILFACGDVDGEGTINIADAVYLISYIFSHGPAPSPLAAGDTDCSGDINIADAVYLINYIFSHGPQPCEACK